MMRQVYHTGWKKSCIDCLVEEKSEQGADTAAELGADRGADRTADGTDGSTDSATGSSTGRTAEKYVAALGRKIAHEITSLR